jgi:hypothetical protein
MAKPRISIVGRRKQVAKIVHCGHRKRIGHSMGRTWITRWTIALLGAVERTGPFLLLASGASCEDCPVWGALILNRIKDKAIDKVALSLFVT